MYISAHAHATAITGRACCAAPGRRAISPGAGYLEMTRAAVDSSAAGAALRGVFFVQPLAGEVVDVLGCAVTPSSEFEVRSGEAACDAALADAAVHCSGSLAAAAGEGRLEHALLRGAEWLGNYW